MVDLFIIGVFAQEGDNTPQLLLQPQGSRRILRVRVSPLESFAFAMALNGHGAFLPADTAEAAPAASTFFDFLSCELMIRLVESCGGRVLAAELLRIEGERIAAELVLKTPTGIARLDCRFADALLLALRGGAAVRMSRSLLNLAEDMNSVIQSLPEETRPFAAGRMSGLPQAAVREKDSPAVPAKAAPLLKPAADVRRNILGAVHKILDQQGLHENFDNILSTIKSSSTSRVKIQGGPQLEIKVLSISRNEESLEGELDAQYADREHQDKAARAKNPEAARNPQAGEAGPGRPQIRIRLSQPQPLKETLENTRHQIPGIPDKVLASIGLSRSEAEALGRESSEEERWAMLLRMLSPETKVSM
jgi:hypothetical protein